MKNWDDFEKWFSNTNFPKNLESLREIPVLDNWINQIKQATAATTTNKNEHASKSNYQIREGKEVLEVTFQLPIGYEQEDILLFVREDFVKIEGLPDQHIELIKLPKLVKSKECKAKIEEDKLIIRLTKRPRPIKFYRHFITN
ncbi:MAG: Hsp20/alpha crystallin family protein [Candidatus Pristimantibacillus lignocellulolyticus]|uniref:Hsp20/alpha crystallin family protein n=1 Tax=Candidatus Pristimantibacillus lignocellulolyticus TaxID=2994561 RepID=A0A9J6ZDP2_9BACL|nr:MAG: Hsp20/alpha crystallin family protein [Candidatus Pristimantibacillus lignocellulolyticus]